MQFMELSNHFTSIGNDRCGSYGTFSSLTIIICSDAVYTYLLINPVHIYLILPLTIWNYAGSNGNFEYPTECTLCCEPCNGSGHCCWVLCAYNTCFLGQYQTIFPILLQWPVFIFIFEELSIFIITLSINKAKHTWLLHIRFFILVKMHKVHSFHIHHSSIKIPHPMVLINR